MNLTQKIISLLKDNKITFEEVDHDEAITCEDSAKLRNKDQKIGGKTILFKDKKEFSLFVISATKQIDSNKVRKILKSDHLRFATEEELMNLIGVTKGALPPIGRDLLPFNLYLENSILENDEIAFNAGILTKSIIIKVKDYLTIVDPKICDFSK